MTCKRMQKRNVLPFSPDVFCNNICFSFIICNNEPNLLLSRRRLGFFFTRGCVGSVLQAEVCYNIFIYTLTIHTGPSTSDSRQTTNYFLHNINNSLTNNNSFCPMALPGVLGCGRGRRGALEWACQSMLYSLNRRCCRSALCCHYFPSMPLTVVTIQIHFTT